MPQCRAEKDRETDMGSGPNDLSKKGEQMKEDAREHIEDMVSSSEQSAKMAFCSPAKYTEGRSQCQMPRSQT